MNSQILSLDQLITAQKEFLYSEDHDYSTAMEISMDFSHYRFLVEYLANINQENLVDLDKYKIAKELQDRIDGYLPGPEENEWLDT